MKRFYFSTMVVAMMLFAACSGNKKDNSIKSENTKQEKIVDEHTARTSLDYEGTYVGVLPTASGAGVNVTIVLKKDTYKKTEQYVEEPEKTFETEGQFTWNEEGNTITLNGEEKPNNYFVGENKLYHLDINGERITGDLSDHYLLKKE